MILSQMIRGLAEALAGCVGYQGSLAFDTAKPDGTPRKLADVTKLAGLGWRAATPLAAGLESTYRWYLDNVAGSARAAAG